jgi:hypothetical protein
MKRLILVTLVFALVGCRPMSIWTVTPSGPPEYQLGWEDGCDTGLSAEDEGIIYRWTFGFKKRPELASSDQYKQGWNEGFTYCRFVLDSEQGASSSFWGN